MLPSCHPSFPVHKMLHSMDYAPYFSLPEHCRSSLWFLQSQMTNMSPQSILSFCRKLLNPYWFPSPTQTGFYTFQYIFIFYVNLFVSFIELAQSLISQLLFFWLALIELLMLPSPSALFPFSTQLSEKSISSCFLQFLLFSWCYAAEPHYWEDWKTWYHYYLLWTQRKLNWSAQCIIFDKWQVKI